jgi:hypothetical protein
MHAQDGKTMNPVLPLALQINNLQRIKNDYLITQRAIFMA